MEDAVGIVRRRGAGIDWAYIERWADEFTAIPGREDLPGRIAQLKES